MAFTCPDCGRTSHHPEDEKEGYCSACHWWTGHPYLGQFRVVCRELEQARPHQVRMKVRMAIMRKDFERLNLIAGAMGCLNRGGEYERIAGEEVAATPHDIRHYWLSEPCNCTGVLN